MRINEIEINCRGFKPKESSSDRCFNLYVFKSPVTFVDGEKNTTIKGISAIIYTNNKKQNFHSANGKPIAYDRISFRPSAADSQYIASMNLEFDKPFKLSDDFLISSTIKNMKIRSESIGRHTGEFMEISMRLILICISDMNSLKESITQPNIPKYHYLRFIRDTVYAEPLKVWNIEDICRNLCISKSYFHRIYLSAFGITFRQDIIQSRLAYASGLLRNTSMSVSEIAEKCGYDSDSYFMRQFKKHRGLTPSEYRVLKEEESVDYAKIFGNN